VSWLDAFFNGLVGPAGPTGPQGPPAPGLATGKTTTSGAASSALLTAPLATASSAGLAYDITATDGTYAANFASGAGTGCQTIGGTLAFTLIPPVISNGFPIAPVGPALGWATGTLSMSVQGPQATVTTAGANGSGKVRLTCADVGGSSTGPFTPAITGVSVTIAGLTVCTEANGTHTATYVDATHVDLAAVASVHTGADTGTIVEATPRVLNWSGAITVSPVAP
jgi:hypothetical protein